MKITESNKYYPPGITDYILLCILSLLYLYLGLLVVPFLTVIGQVYFIYTSKLWVKRYGDKRNFSMLHSLYHLGHPRLITEIGIMLFIAGAYLAPAIMLVQSFWLDGSCLFWDIVRWIANLYSVAYYIYLIRKCIKKMA